jgi:hypothetical protein
MMLATRPALLLLCVLVSTLAIDGIPSFTAGRRAHNIPPAVGRVYDPTPSNGQVYDLPGLGPVTQPQYAGYMYIDCVCLCLCLCLCLCVCGLCVYVCACLRVCVCACVRWL